LLPLLVALLLCRLAGPGPGLADAGARVDQAGRQVLVPDTPARIVALAPSLVEIVYALGCGERLAGATLYSEHPAAAQGLPRVGSYARPDVERVLALRPDLCLAVVDMTPLFAIETIQNLGIPVYCLDTSSIDAVLESIVRIGAVLHVEDYALMLTQRMNEWMRLIRQAVRDVDRPRVLYQIGHQPMHTACADTFTNELIERAGGTNVCNALRGYPLLTREQAVAYAPEVILIPTMGKDEFAAARDSWSQWPELPAVREGRIHMLDSDVFDRPGPRIPLALEGMARLLHPGLSLPGEPSP